MFWSTYCPERVGIKHDRDFQDTNACPHCGGANPTKEKPDTVVVIPDSPPAMQSIRYSEPSSFPIQQASLSRFDILPRDSNAARLSLPTSDARPHAGTIIQSARPPVPASEPTQNQQTNTIPKISINLIIYLGSLVDAELDSYKGWTQLNKNRVRIPLDAEVQSELDLSNLLCQNLKTWDKLKNKIQPVETFLASECNPRDGPVKVPSQGWDEPLSRLLPACFSSTGNGVQRVWKVYLCIVQAAKPADEDDYDLKRLEALARQNQSFNSFFPKEESDITESVVKKEPGIKKEPKIKKESKIKKEPKIKKESKIKKEKESKDLSASTLSRKRSFSDAEMRDTIQELEEYMKEAEQFHRKVFGDSYKPNKEGQEDEEDQEDEEGEEDEEEQDEENLDAPAGRTRFKKNRLN